MLGSRLRSILLISTVVLSAAWWGGVQEEDPNAKVALEVEESLEQRKVWSKLSLGGAGNDVAKAIAMHKARALRDAQTPEEEEAARAALESLLEHPDTLAEVLQAHLSDGRPSQKYRAYVSRTQDDEAQSQGH